MGDEARRQFTLDELAPVFEALARLDHPCVLFGGQSVYLWSRRFMATEPVLREMERLTPFLSKDVDFQGGREAAIAFARALGTRAEVPSIREAFGNLMAGNFSLALGADRLKVEVLRKIPGLSANEVKKLSLLDLYGGTAVRVLNPVAVMMAKAWNVANISREGRRDSEQLLVTVVCVRAFLRSLLAAAGSDRASLRLVLKLVECALNFVESPTARRAAKRCGVDWSQLVPHSLIAASSRPELVALRERRLPLWLARIQRYDRGVAQSPDVCRLLEVLDAHAEPLCVQPSANRKPSSR